jgi:hypothetical protein
VNPPWLVRELPPEGLRPGMAILSEVAFPGAVTQLPGDPGPCMFAPSAVVEELLSGPGERPARVLAAGRVHVIEVERVRVAVRA